MTQRAGEGPAGRATKGRRTSRDAKRLALAFAVAGASDVATAFLGVVPPLQWLLDLATAALLFMLLGRQWAILPGLIAEAVPGLAVFPFWVLVVGSIGIWGSIRRAGDTGEMR
jgi:hypothetical protein